MDTNHELTRMQRAAMLRPGLTPLQASLIDDGHGRTTRRGIRRFNAVADELAGRADVSVGQGNTLEIAALHRATIAAAETLALHWELLHGRPLPAPTRPLVRRAVTRDAATQNNGPDAFIEALGDCAVLAAVANDIERGDQIRQGLQAVAPDRREHDVLYALALNFNGDERRAESLFNELMRCRQYEARAAGAFGFVLQTRGDERWREMFDRAERSAADPDLRRFVEFWTEFAESPVH